MENIKTKACIVGSGVAGALCAKYLSKTLDDIVILERGANMSHAERLKTKRQEIEVNTAIHRDVVVGEVPGKRIQYLYAVGGTTNHWTGQTPRFLPNDFRMKSAYGIMEDWPVSYEELEPFYCIAEEELSVAGGPDNARVPRSKPFPMEPHPFSPMDLLFQQCFPQGSIVSSPQSRPTRPVGDRPACCGSATCGLCPVDSKYTTLNTHIPQLEQMKSVRILSQKVVLYLQTDGTRKIKRAFALGNHGEQLSIEADLFILAANALENPAIILRSNDLKHHSSTGKYFFDHINFPVTFLLNQRGFPGYGQSLFTAHCYQFYDGDFRRRHSAALGEVYSSGLGVEYFVREALRKGLTGARLREAVTREYERQIVMNFMLEDLPDPERCIRIGKKSGELGIPETEIFYKKNSNYVVEARNVILKEIPAYVDRLGVKKMIPGKLDDKTGHLLGTCRMGPYETGAVDNTLRYQEADNLYVLGGSAFPTYSPSNPTLTIAALAIRLGMYLANNRGS
jgi:choline dehydrogenase-like flavoprotein